MVAPQALMLLNDSFVQQEAALFAERVWLECAAHDDATHIRRAFALALQRSPNERESQAAVGMLAQQRDLAPGGDAARTALRNFCAALLNVNEFVYVD